ncbi:MAG TPA: methyltransferase domain-containing protein [Streptosporangiaceae bacterium]|nr:methyltransferase domain-containing protein [Streptosporangiaceae bacterium]
MSEDRDKWHRWLTHGRFGGDAELRERELTRFLYPVRDEVLDRSGLQPGETLLDVGSGDGLIGLGALDRTGPAGHVIFSDISRDLLDHCRDAAAAEGALTRCSFVLAGADSLEVIPDAAADVVTTRSVLIYVKDKAAAFAEFHRVLRPGGRVSIFEPVNVLMGDGATSRFSGYDVAPVAAIAAKLRAVYETLQPPGTDPMLDFDDRDLVRLASSAGFGEVSLELQVTVRASRPPMPWERFLATSGNPLIPSIGEAMDQVLDAGEIRQLTDHLRPLVEAGTGQERRAVAYLTAVKSSLSTP